MRVMHPAVNDLARSGRFRFSMGLLAHIFALTALVRTAYPQIASPGGVSQGRFAGMLYAFLNATNESAYSALEGMYSDTNVTEQTIATAVECLENDGLTPFGGWRTSELLRLRDVASLVVRCHHADDAVDVSDRDACVAFAKTRGCDLGAIKKVVRHIWEQKWGSGNEAASADDPLRGSPAVRP